MLQYETVPVTPFQQNCSIVWSDETMKAAIIDPGGDLSILEDACKQLGVTLEQIWITHAHIDHAGGTTDLAAQWLELTTNATSSRSNCSMANGNNGR